MTTTISRLGLIAALVGSLLATGCASAPEQKPAAPAAAEKPAELKDEALAAAVQAALNADVELAPFRLKVSGKGKDVTIEGATDTGEQMAKAGLIAEKVKGVQYVFNNIMPKN
ncbi:MAG TPA: BON domain-containing protein [Chitinolyticbacter sp.]|nr:BON domain-containing protein [Chitinolyticbacter sp.]